jgi:3-hydroxybutyryl-CoA dehydrogenase
MNIDDVRRVLIIGSGTMGLQIGLQCATHGYQVVLYDIEPAALEKGLQRIRAYADEQLSAGVIDADGRQRALANITSTTDPAVAARDADLVSESVPEDPALKGRVLAQFHALCPSRTIFTTNTSTLVPSMFAAATGRPDRFAALHFHAPVWRSNVADVMPHAGTSPETTELLLAFARRIGQVPIHVRKESSGYVFNAMYNAINREAITLAANGVASVEDVDRAWMGIMKMPMGPFGMLDGVGLDTVLHITDYWAGRTGDAQLRANAGFLKTYVDRGRLGIKSGEGFYRYPDPAYSRPGFPESGTIKAEPTKTAAPLPAAPAQERPWGFRGQRGITAAFEPADPALYRSLLPAAFDLPVSPLVVVAVVSYYDVTLPLVPYGEGYVLLECRYQGRTGWYVVSMPVDDRTACDGGRSIGFPKYVADRIDLGKTDSGWHGRVAHQGRDILAVTFTPNADAQPVATSSTDPGLPCFLLRPPAQGPLVSQVDTRLFGPRATLTTAGSATVQADPGEAWAGLLPAGGGPASATLDEMTGDWILVQARLSQPMPRSLVGALQRVRGQRP